MLAQILSLGFFVQQTAFENGTCMSTDLAHGEAIIFKLTS